MSLRIAADVGGTFTDIVATDGDRQITVKVPSTPPAFEKGVLDGVERAISAMGVAPSEVEILLHGTTAGTNAVLERTAPPCALVTTAGFRDVLEIGRLRTPQIYDLRWHKPPPLAPREHRLEVPERTTADGTVVAEPDFSVLAPALDEAVSSGVVAVAVSLLNSYANPSNEQRVAEWIAGRYPSLFVTAGTELGREAGEFERSSTATLNAYLRPIISRYFEQLAAGAASSGITAPVLIMQSSGGMMPIEQAARYPVHTLESGPAAGVLASARVAGNLGEPGVVSFDMGGTTAKASLVEHSEVTRSAEFSVGSSVSSTSRLLRGGGYAVRLPVIDLAEIGAGGGSIAHVDAAGGLHVGPRSAGADPGPACYGRGGTQPTVTDANLMLGLISVEGLARGGITADADAAARAVHDNVAVPLGLTVIDAARAVHAVADQHMARVLRAVTTERGRDLRAQALVAFGGSGPLHAATLADSVDVRRVVVPPSAGVLSAVGLLWSPIELAMSETVDARLQTALAADLRSRVLRSARELADRLVRSGLPAYDITTGVVAEVSFEGQASPLPLRLEEEVTAESLADLADRFRRAHAEAYGHVPDNPLRLVRLRISATVARESPPTARVEQGASSEVRVTRLDDDETPAPVVTRDQLDKRPRSGPLLIDDRETTTVVPRGWSVRLEPSTFDLVLERR